MQGISLFENAVLIQLQRKKTRDEAKNVFFQKEETHSNCVSTVQPVTLSIDVLNKVENDQ